MQRRYLKVQFTRQNILSNTYGLPTTLEFEEFTDALLAMKVHNYTIEVLGTGYLFGEPKVVGMITKEAKHRDVRIEEVILSSVYADEEVEIDWRG